MRVGALGAQFGALFHAEAVLLVDDGQLQILELHGLFNDGMRADHDLDVAPGKALANGVLFGFGSVANQQADLLGAQDAGASGQEPRKGGVVLLGQDAGRRHDGGLGSMRGDHGGGQGGDDGLAGADVTLQQAVHGLAGIKVRADLGDGAGLGGGEGKREGGQLRLQPFVGEGKAATVDLFPVALLAQDTHLQEEDLIEGEAGPGGLQEVV